MANLQPMNQAHLAQTAAALAAELLDHPELPSVIQALTPETLGQVVRQIGLEDSGELLALATPRQLEALLDEDVWHAPRAGEPERFAPRRFALWLEVLMQDGTQAAIKKLSSLDETFLTMALASLTRVFDIDWMQTALDGMQEEDDPAQFEKALDGLPQLEFDAYLVVGRYDDAWDALSDLLSTLYEEDFPLFCRLMRHCALATTSAIEDEGGVTALLTADEELSEDAAGARQERREARGYVDPVNAATLLKVLRRGKRTVIATETNIDPVVDSYLSNLRNPSPPEQADAAPYLAGSLVSKVTRFMALLEQNGNAPETFVALPVAGKAHHEEDLFRSAMKALREQAPETYQARKHELSFLANAVLAGEAREGKRERPADVASQVIRACSEGLAWLREHHPERAAAVLRESFGVITLFRLALAS